MSERHHHIFAILASVKLNEWQPDYWRCPEPRITWIMSLCPSFNSLIHWYCYGSTFRECDQFTCNFVIYNFCSIKIIDTKIDFKMWHFIFYHKDALEMKNGLCSQILFYYTKQEKHQETCSHFKFPLKTTFYCLDIWLTKWITLENNLTENNMFLTSQTFGTLFRNLSFKTDGNISRWVHCAKFYETISLRPIKSNWSDLYISVSEPSILCALVIKF